MAEINDRDLINELLSMNKDVMNVGQRLDKLEYTASDLKNEFLVLKTNIETLERDREYRRGDWIRNAIIIASVFIVTSFLIWYSMTSRIHNLERYVEKDAYLSSKSVTKDELSVKLLEIQKSIDELNKHVNLSPTKKK